MVADSFMLESNIELVLYYREEFGAKLIIKVPGNQFTLELYRDLFTLTEYGIRFYHGLGMLSLTSEEVAKVHFWLTKYSFAPLPMIPRGL